MSPSTTRCHSISLGRRAGRYGSETKDPMKAVSFIDAPGYFVEVRVTDAASLQDQLTAGVEIVQQQAISYGRHGVLITQHGYTAFTIAISPEVPYGETREHRQWTHGHPEEQHFEAVLPKCQGTVAAVINEAEVG